MSGPAQTAKNLAERPAPPGSARVSAELTTAGTATTAVAVNAPECQDIVYLLGSASGQTAQLGKKKCQTSFTRVLLWICKQPFKAVLSPFQKYSERYHSRSTQPATKPK